MYMCLCFYLLDFTSWLSYPGFGTWAGYCVLEILTWKLWAIFSRWAVFKTILIHMECIIWKLIMEI